MYKTSRLIEPVSMIVLTGGPCSGKSSSLAYFTEKLSDHGFMVFVIPETATLITNSGIDRRKMNKSKQVRCMRHDLLRKQYGGNEMKNIDTRIKKLEDAVKPNTPHCILAFSQEEADEKVREYQEAHPGEAEPLMIIVEFVDAPVRSER